MADSPEEKAHWHSVLKAFDGYMQYHLSANHARRMAFLALPKDHKQIYEIIGYREKLDAVDEGIRRNAEFIDEMIADPVFSDMLHGPTASSSSSTTSEGHSHAHEFHDDSHGHGSSHDHSHTHGHGHPQSNGHSGTSANGSRSPRNGNRDSEQEKVRSTLRSFVRDWSKEGEVEREACYTPILSALEAKWPERSERGGKKILIPGSGLGRLAMEVAARGFAAQANEFSVYMLVASNFVLNQTTKANSHFIHPFLHSFSNHLLTQNLLKRVSIPDTCPVDVLGDGRGGDFSLVAGDFEDIYSDPAQAGIWSSVVTCFFIDTARNVLRYLRIIYDLLEDGGIWINLGPLLWHFENSTKTSSRGEGSIELSLDEVKSLARKVGFTISDEREVKSSYTGIPDSMLRHEYQAAFWIATKASRTASDQQA